MQDLRDFKTRKIDNAVSPDFLIVNWNKNVLQIKINEIKMTDSELYKKWNKIYLKN